MQFLNNTVNSVYSSLNRYFMPDEISLVMEEKEIEILTYHLKQSQSFLEFGSGGSTLLAIAHSKCDIITVDSDEKWLQKIKDAPISRFHRYNPGRKTKFVHVDIGELKNWGYPLNDNKRSNYPKYSKKIFKEVLDKSRVDLVLIDGRFRVACALQTILELNGNTNLTILIHDFFNRPNYHVLLDYLKVVDQAATLGVFQIQENVNLDEVRARFKKFKNRPN